MADEDRQSKTEEPTPKRLEEARQKGQVAKSTELTSALVLLTGLAISSLHGPSALASLRAAMKGSLTWITREDLTPGQVFLIADRIGSWIYAVASPLVFSVAFAAVLTTTVQIGFRFYPKRIQPKLDKLSPKKGLTRIFSAQGAMELAKSIFKIGLVGLVAWNIVLGAQVVLPQLSHLGPREIMGTMGAQLWRMILWVVSVLGFLSLFDFAFQKYQHQQGLKMTKQEVKDESKQQEGDPQVKAQVRKAYTSLSSNKMLSEVETADVVITNPVHFAVALKYDAGSMEAPTVVAKGAEHVALRIKERAREKGVPILERRSLARALFRAVPVGGQIPQDLFRAVAEVLAYIYGLRAQKAAH